MPPYKAFISDFDGTIMGENRMITPRLKTAVQAYVSGGGVFVVASGRGWQGPIRGFYEEVGISGHAIVRAGAEIIEVSQGAGHVIWEKFIPELAAREIIAYLNGENLELVAESGEYIYTQAGHKEAAFGDVIFQDIKTIDYEKVPKIILRPLYPKELVERQLDMISTRYPQVHAIMISSPYGVGLDITDVTVSKHSTLHRLAKMIGIGSHEMVGIGDSYNDLPLLMACGLRIAMGNAPKELSDVADHVVATQAEDGVVEALGFVR